MVVTCPTTVAATSRSLALVVVTAPLFSAVLWPVCWAVTSTGVLGSSPLYSTKRMSGHPAAALKATVTTFAFAAEATMFLA